MTVQRAALARRGVLWALEQVPREHAPSRRCGLRGSTAKPNSRKHLLDAIKTALLGLLLLHLRLARCTEREAKVVRLLHAQQSTLFPAPGKRLGATSTSCVGLFTIDGRTTEFFFLLPRTGPAEPRAAMPAEYPETNPEANSKQKADAYNN